MSLQPIATCARVSTANWEHTSSGGEEKRDGRSSVRRPWSARRRIITGGGKNNGGGGANVFGRTRARTRACVQRLYMFSLFLVCSISFIRCLLSSLSFHSYTHTCSLNHSLSLSLYTRVPCFSLTDRRTRNVPTSRVLRVRRFACICRTYGCRCLFKTKKPSVNAHTFSSPLQRR